MGQVTLAPRKEIDSAFLVFFFLFFLVYLLCNWNRCLKLITRLWVAFNLFLVDLQQLDSLMCCSAAQSCLTLCDPVECGTPGLPVPHQLLKRAQTHVHRVGDAIQPSHPLSSPSPPAFNLSRHQGLFQGVRSLHRVAKVSELQHQSMNDQG